MLVTVVLFLVMSVVFYRTLFMKSLTEWSPASLDKHLPTFNLPTVLKPEKETANKDLPGQVFLLNVWASWCVACRVEHPYLLELAKQGVVIYGVNYKDNPIDAGQWLDKLDNPYVLSVNDQDGRLGMNLGVYGVPETYLVDHKGVIRYKHIGVVDQRIWIENLQVRYEALQKESG